MVQLNRFFSRNVMLLQSLERLLLKCANNHFQVSLKFLH